MRGAHDAALYGRSRRYQHLIQHPPAVPGFDWVEDEFSAVLAANDSGHARILCQRHATGLLTSVVKIIAL
jgi:hypothetical protein